MVKNMLNPKGRGVRTTLGIAIIFATLGFLIAQQVAIDVHTATATQNSCGINCVLLKVSGAEPSSLSVKVGEQVRFISADGRSHYLSLGKRGEEHEHAGPFNSGVFQADEAWWVRFKTPGTYTFHDHNNPSINIIVAAYQEANDPSTKF